MASSGTYRMRYPSESDFLSRITWSSHENYRIGPRGVSFKPADDSRLESAIYLAMRLLYRWNVGNMCQFDGFYCGTEVPSALRHT